MAKRRVNTRGRNELKALAESSGLVGAAGRRPWPERKERAKRRAKKGEYDPERMFFRGSLEDLISDCAEHAIRVREDLFDDNLLAGICEVLADELAERFRDGNNSTVTEDAAEFALAFLYLFPKLWKALDRPLTLDEMKSLDFDELLSQRR